MSTRFLTILVFLFCFLHITSISSTTGQINRVALVIGNTNYLHVPILQNPVNDSQDIADKLEELNFKVNLRHDLDKKDMEQAILLFGKSLQNSHIAIFFYAGHAIQVNGTNYLIPVSTRATNQNDIIAGSLTLDDLLLKLSDPGSRTNIIILDACRNNPFPDSQSIEKQGLARIITDAPHTLIAYSTQPNNYALDGEGRNSPYTKVLLDYIGTPGLRLDALFSNVAWTVEENSKVQNIQETVQSPWISHSPLPPICLAGCLDKAPQTLVINVPDDSKLVDSPNIKTTETSNIASNTTPASAIKKTNTYVPVKSILELQNNYVAINKKCFTMGSPTDERGRTRDELQHEICVDTFEIAQNEITMGDFAFFVKTTGYVTDAEKPNGSGCFVYDQKWQNKKTANWRNPGFEQDPREPVVCVSWNDTQVYAKWLTKNTKAHYRLPTEAEWELVAKDASDSSSLRLADNNLFCRYENISDVSARLKFKGWKGYQCTDSYIHTAPIGSYQANNLGIYDTLGNVKEFTCSSYVTRYNGDENKCAVNTEMQRIVMRGGSWSDGPMGVRVAKRRRIIPNESFSYAGFRLVRHST
jgi:formylglycine-generating enzyme required for sulfatase activity